MLTTQHVETLVGSEQYGLGLDLVSRLSGATSFAERLTILEEAEDVFDQVEVREHAVRVAEGARRFAIHCGFDAGYSNSLYNATRFHDIGKLFVPNDILNKNGSPTDEEYGKIKTHAGTGKALLGENAPDFVANIAAYHHEQYSGRGYAGLAGEDIPLEARLVQIADVYDALVSDRPYKAGMPEETALVTMLKDHQVRGVMFDPYLLRRFFEMRLEADLDQSLPRDIAEELRAFAASDPMSDLRFTGKEDFGGWKIDRKGNRRLYEYDDAIGVNKLVEKRDTLGEVKFRLVDQAPRDILAAEAANDDKPRGPRF